MKVDCSPLRTLLIVLLLWNVAVPISADETALRIVTGRSSSKVVVDHLIEGFRKLNPQVEVEARPLGTLFAIEAARQGKADILITYYRAGERELLKEKVVSNRIELMFTSYVIFGPPGDELGLLQETTLEGVLRKIAKNQVPFIVPSANGGTYHKLLSLWESVGIKPDWPWYELTNTTSLGAVRLAAQLGAYTVADIGTYLLHREEFATTLVPLYQGGYELHKAFSVMQVNPKTTGRRENPDAEKFIEFITSDRGQRIITEVNRDEFNGPVFFPAAHFDPTVMANRANKEILKTNRNLYAVTVLLVITGSLLLIVVYMFFRTRLLQRAKLQAEIDKGVAELANNTKSEFLSQMSHELRTPLNAILGFSQILEMREEDAEKKSQLKDIVKAGQHLHYLINDVLELSNIESHRVEVVMGVVDVDEIVNDCLVLCYQEFKKSDISASVHGSLQYNVSADPNRLKEILLNLLTNAIKYNKTQGKVNITAQQVGNGSLRLSVTDTGRGISEEKQTHLFEPFERLGLETSNIEGTGIGLVICKSLIERMSGQIGFESQQEQGSTFWIELNLA